MNHLGKAELNQIIWKILCNIVYLVFSFIRDDKTLT